MKCEIPLLGLTLDMTNAKDLDILEALITGARGKFQRQPKLHPVVNEKFQKPRVRKPDEIIVLGSAKPPSKGVGSQVVTAFEKLEAKIGKH